MKFFLFFTLRSHCETPLVKNNIYLVVSDSKANSYPVPDKREQFRVNFFHHSTMVIFGQNSNYIQLIVTGLIISIGRYFVSAESGKRLQLYICNFTKKKGSVCRALASFVIRNNRSCESRIKNL